MQENALVTILAVARRLAHEATVTLPRKNDNHAHMVEGTSIILDALLTSMQRYVITNHVVQTNPASDFYCACTSKEYAEKVARALNFFDVVEALSDTRPTLDI